MIIFLLVFLSDFIIRQFGGKEIDGCQVSKVFCLKFGKIEEFDH